MSYYVPNNGYQYQPPDPRHQFGPPPHNHQVMAIIAIVICAPFGAVALIKSSQVEPRHFRGDFAGAVETAKAVKRWAIIAFIVGPLLSVACSGLRIVQALHEAGAI